jgi:hypothetical protein
MEINVRPWLAIMLLMLLAGIAMGAYGYIQASHERRIIESGTPVTATVANLGQDTRQMPRDEPVRVTLGYTDPVSRRTISSERLIHRKPGAVIKLKDEIPVRIDPADPTFWTARTEPVPILQPLLVPLVILPVVLICGLATFWQRGRVMKVVKAGSIKRATVASVRQSPLAPLSKQIGVTIEGADRTVRQAYWPSGNGAIAKGDAIDILSTGGSIVLPVRSYQ